MADEAYILDTSVVVRWFLGQTGWQHARKIRDRFVAGELLLETVECARFEVPWVLLRKGLQLGNLSKDEYIAACRSIDDLGISVFGTDVDTLEQAASLSANYMITFFDAVFIVRALHTGRPLLTADMRLARGAAHLVRTVVLDDR
jgi:predicted nucleic acid-binding protein